MIIGWVDVVVLYLGNVDGAESSCVDLAEGEVVNITHEYVI